MDRQKLKAIAEKMIAEIEKYGVGAIFEMSSPDPETIYLKSKVLSQLHKGDRDYLDERLFDAYVSGKEKPTYFVSHDQRDVATRTSEIILKESHAYHDMKKPKIEYFEMLTIYTYYETLAKLDCYQKMAQDDFCSKYKFACTEYEYGKDTYKAYMKRMQKIQAAAKKECAVISKVLAKMDITKLIEKYPEEASYLSSIIPAKIEKEVESRYSNYREKLSVKDVKDIMEDVSFSFSTPSKDAKDKAEWCERADRTAQAVLTTFTLEPGVSLEEVIKTVRGVMSHGEEDVKLEYRTHNLPQRKDPIGQQSEPAEFIAESMQRLFDKYNSIDWKTLPKEEILKESAKIAFEFVRIHPFGNGNGRTYRIILDYILTSNGVESPLLFKSNDTKMDQQDAIRRCTETYTEPFEQYVVKKYEAQFGEIANKKVIQKPEILPEQKAIFERSILLSGVDSESSDLVARKLGEERSLPVINLVLLKHCPKTIEEIEIQKQAFLREMKEKEDEFRRFPKREHEAQRKLADFDEQIRLRKMFPDLPNYEELGYKPEIDKYIIDSYSCGDPSAVKHFYHKQFDIKFLQEFMKRLKTPAIIDLGVELSAINVSYIKEVLHTMKRIDIKFMRENFDLNAMNPTELTSILKNFKNFFQIYTRRTDSREPITDVICNDYHYIFDYGQSTLIEGKDISYGHIAESDVEKLVKKVNDAINENELASQKQ